MEVYRVVFYGKESGAQRNVRSTFRLHPRIATSCLSSRTSPPRNWWLNRQRQWNLVSALLLFMMSLTFHDTLMQERIWINRVESEIVFQPLHPDITAPLHEERVTAMREEPSLHFLFYQRDVTDGMRSLHGAERVETLDCSGLPIDGTETVCASHV